MAINIDTVAGMWWRFVHNVKKSKVGRASSLKSGVCNETGFFRNIIGGHARPSGGPHHFMFFLDTAAPAAATTATTTATAA
ncbi:MAG: hypothetical protein ABJE25_05145, partial [Parasphingorhabdus sp.]|uniref:hypothetical protein n=1 Tax=Parasphingorhabdus sp. TaxID=2709688 RepID=UPI0032645355